MSRVRTIGALAMLLSAFGCGGFSEGSGRLVVEPSYEEGLCCLGDEGEVIFLSIEGAGVQRSIAFHPSGDAGYPSIARSDLDPGSYSLMVSVRTCAGTCDRLDPPLEDYSCGNVVKVATGRETRIQLVLHRSTCSI